jgi:hypothetical protein
MHRAGLFLVGLAALAQPVPDRFYFESGKVRVLILTGKNNHDWRATTPFLRQVLDAAGRFDVRTSEEPGTLGEESLRPYDVLVMNYCGPRWSAGTEAAVESFVKNGKGLVVVHAGSYPFGETAVLSEKMGRTEILQQPWKAWGDMVGAVWSDKDPRTGHAQRHAYRVQWQDKSHPVAAGMEPEFLLSDELYHNFRLKPTIHVLASAFDSPAIGGNGKVEPLVWTNAYGKGRVFHTALGHDVSAMQSPGFVSSFARGVEWAATEKVTLAAKLDTDPKDPNAVRALIVTGGHDHETSFYRILDGYRDIRVTVDPHPQAFRTRILKEYDVIVVYDTVEEVPEQQKKTLVQFLEAGHGLVYLHHSLASFQNWEWWWKEVTGSLYFLKAAPGNKASTYLHDVEMVVTPKGQHPIVKGLPQMRLYDETYKDVWHAPGVEVLLETDHPTSDKVVGWIGPYRKSRVVVLQPGHGRETHELPWFRELVRRSVLWSAGR